MNSDLVQFERIGGSRAVDEIVEVFHQRVLNDLVLSEFFTDSDPERLRSMQREYVTVALGGTGTFAGSRLREAHSGRGIGNKHYARFLNLFLDTISDRRLRSEDIDRVVDRIAIASTDVLSSPTEAG